MEASAIIYGTEGYVPDHVTIQANREARKLFDKERRERLRPEVAWGSLHMDNQKGPSQRAKWTEQEIDIIEKHFNEIVAKGQVSTDAITGLPI